jgi:hypothetical protein
MLNRVIHAEEFTTLDGEHYPGATLKRVEPDGLVISYPDGVVKLKFKNLSSEIKEKYRYNPDAEKDFIEKRQAEEVKRSQEKQPDAKGTVLASLIPISSKQLLDKKIEAATHNCEIIKKRIAYLEQESFQQTSQQGRFYLKEELAKKKSELPILEATLAKLITEKYPPPTNPLPPPPPPSFLEKYGSYLLWSLIGLVGIVLFLRKKS